MKNYPSEDEGKMRGRNLKKGKKKKEIIYEKEKTEFSTIFRIWRKIIKRVRFFKEVKLEFFSKT